MQDIDDKENDAKIFKQKLKKNNNIQTLIYNQTDNTIDNNTQKSIKLIVLLTYE